MAKTDAENVSFLTRRCHLPARRLTPHCFQFYPHVGQFFSIVSKQNQKNPCLRRHLRLLTHIWLSGHSIPSWNKQRVRLSPREMTKLVAKIVFVFLFSGQRCAALPNTLPYLGCLTIFSNVGAYTHPCLFPAIFKHQNILKIICLCLQLM